MTPCVDHGLTGNDRGYGYRRVNGKKRRVHRLAYAEAHGLDEATMEGHVLHACDNPRCINVEHLSLGDHTENMRQRNARKRANLPHGEQHYKAKLTEAQVQALRDEYVPRHPEHGGRAMARRLGMSQAAVAAALKGDSW